MSQPPPPGWAPPGYLPILVAPFAWVVGNRVVREIAQSGGQYAGHDTTNTGRILGIIGTGLLLAGGLLVTAFVAWIGFGAWW